MPRHGPTGTAPWERPAPADRAAHSDAIERRITTASARIGDRRPSAAARGHAAQHARHDHRRRRLRRAARHVRPDRRHRRDVAARLDRAGLAVPLVGPGRSRSRPAHPWRDPPPERPDPARPVRQCVPVRRDGPASGPATRPTCGPASTSANGSRIRCRVLPALGRVLGGEPLAPTLRRQWRAALELALRTLRTEQRMAASPYRFRRPDGDPTDDSCRIGGRGAPTPAERHGPRRVPAVGRCLGAAAERAGQPGPGRGARAGRAGRRGRGCARLPRSQRAQSPRRSGLASRPTGSCGSVARRSGPTRSMASAAAS